MTINGIRGWWAGAIVVASGLASAGCTRQPEPAVLSYTGGFSGSVSIVPGAEKLSPIPAEFFLDKIYTHERPLFELKMKNTCVGALTVKDVKSTCGCMKPELFSERRIEPGQQGVFRFRLASSKGGKTTSTLSFIPAEKGPLFSLKVHYESIPLLPEFVELGTVRAEQLSQLHELSVAGIPGRSVTLQSVESLSPALKAYRGSSPGEIEFMLNAALRPGEPIDGIIQAKLLDGTTQKEFQHRVRVVGTIETELQVQPEHISLGLVTEDEPVHRQLRVASRAWGRIETLTASLAPVAGACVVRQLDGGWAVDLEIDMGQWPEDAGKVECRLEAGSGSRRATVFVPVYAVVQR